FSALCARLTYLSQNPEPEAPANDTPPPSAEDYTNWGVPGDIKAFGLTGDKNPLLEERAAVTCRDCLLKDHKAGTPECPQYEWRKELWGDLPKNENQSGMASNNNTRFIYEFSERTKVSLSFQELKLNESLIQSLNHAKLQGPHGVQQCAVLPAINGRNVIAQAPSETGKTTAIIICIAQLIDAFKKGVQALVISPTEQKATEIHSMVNLLGYQCYNSSGSQSVRDDLVALAEGHGYPILVGTPDRILQHLCRGLLDTSKIKILALDDLDTLVDNGFRRQIPDIYHCLPRSIQTIGTCSVLPSNILKESKAYIHNPLYVAIEQFNGLSRKMTHAFVVIPQDGQSDTKARTLHSLIYQGNIRVRAGILCNMLADVECVREQLRQLGYIYPYVPTNANSETYHELIRNFRAGSNNRQLITTYSVPLKRLLGAWGVSGDNFWIVNFNTPCSPQNYLERVNYLGICSGRNTAITLVDDGTDEINMIREIEQHFGIQMVELRWDGNSLL
ncbi:unnamed protein product, partial [Rhizoctonia solani]